MSTVAATTRGAVGTATGTTTVTCAPTSTLPKGDLGVLVLAYDNSGTSGADPYSSIANDSAGNVWTSRAAGLADPGAASAGATVRIFTSPITTQLTSAGSVVVTFSATTSAKAYAFWSINESGGAMPVFRLGGAGSASTTTPTVTTSGVIFCDECVIGGAALEGADSWTADSDTTQGSWSAKLSAAQGSGATGMSVCSQSKIVDGSAATATQTFNPTNTSGDCVAAYVVISPGTHPAASGDDGKEQGDGTVTINDESIIIRDSGTDSRWTGIRFPNVNIPTGVTIANAYLELCINTGKADDMNCRIYCEAADSPAIMTTSASSISGRSRTSASTDWVAANQTAVGGWARQKYIVSPDISGPVQEWVNRGGRAANAPLMLIINALSATDNASIGGAWDTTANDPWFRLRYVIATAVSGTANPSAHQHNFTVNAATATGDATGAPTANQRNFTINAVTATVSNTASPASHQHNFSFNATTATGGATATPAANQRNFTLNATTATGGATASTTAHQHNFTINPASASGATNATATPTVHQHNFTLNATTASGGGTAAPAVHQHDFTVQAATATVSNTAAPASVARSFTLNAVTATGDATATPLIFLRLDGAPGTRAATPDSAGLQLTGDIDVRVRCSLDDWTPTAAQALFAQWNDVAVNNRSWLFRVQTTGVLVLNYSNDGTANLSTSSTAATGFADGSIHWCRATMDVNDGAGNRVIKFYTSNDSTNDADAVSWTQLGTTVTTAGTTSFFNSTSECGVGAYAAGGSGMASGNFYAAQLKDGYDGAGSVLASPLFQTTLPYTDTQGNVWSGFNTAHLDPGGKFVVPTVATTGAANAAPAVHQHDFTVNPATATGGAPGTASPLPFSCGFTINAATATGSASAAPADHQHNFTLNAATATVSNTATPTSHQHSFTLNAVSAAGSGQAAPTAHQHDFTIPAVTATGGGSATATPAVHQHSFTLNATTATGGGTAAPASGAYAFSVPAATATVGNTAAPASVVAQAGFPAVTATGGASAAPTAVLRAFTIPTPGTVADATASTTSHQHDFTVNPASASGTGAGAASPASHQHDFTINAPTVTVSVTAAPTAHQHNFSVPAATASASNTAAPAAIARSFTFNTPAVTATAVASPASHQHAFTIEPATASGSATGTATPAAIARSFTVAPASATGDAEATTTSHAHSFTIPPPTVTVSASAAPATHGHGFSVLPVIALGGGSAAAFPLTHGHAFTIPPATAEGEIVLENPIRVPPLVDDGLIDVPDPELEGVRVPAGDASAIKAPVEVSVMVVAPEVVEKIEVQT